MPDRRGGLVEVPPRVIHARPFSRDAQLKALFAALNAVGRELPYFDADIAELEPLSSPAPAQGVDLQNQRLLFILRQCAQTSTDPQLLASFCR